LVWKIFIYFILFNFTALRRISRMARGKLGILTGLVVLGLFAVFTVSPAVAQPVTSNEPAAGTDDLAPGPVMDLELAIDQEEFTVTLSWMLSDDDFERQVPAGGDFSSGGTFVNTNDVSEYVIYRDEDDGDSEEIGYAEASIGEFTDDSPVAGISYVYCVSAIDAAGNESEELCSDPVSLGPPGEVEVEGPEELEETEVEVVVIEVEGEVDTEDEDQVQALIDDFIALLTRLFPDIDPSRFANITVTEGSIIFTFDILPADDGSEEDAAADVAADLAEIVENEPEEFESIGPVLGFSNLQTSKLDFGAVDTDGEASSEFSFENTSTDPDAVLVITASVDGAGFSVSAEELVLAAGEQGFIDVSFSAADVGNLNGSYDGTFDIGTNDPNWGSERIDLAAQIEEGFELAAIDVDPPSIDFGVSGLDEPKIRILTISNEGDFDLDVSLETTGDDVFSLSSTSETIAGRGSVEIEVSYAPTEEGDNSGSITVTSTDADNPEITVGLSGSASTSTEQRLVGEDGAEIFGDFDGDAEVGFSDFFQFADNFGKKSDAVDFDAAFDLDGDNEVGFGDFFQFADNFGKKGTYE
jgi:hypothetical protein